MTLDEQILDAQMTEAAERIRCSAWLENLAKRWDRTLAERNNISWSERDAGSGEQLAQCVRELRAEIAKLSNIVLDKSSLL